MFLSNAGASSQLSSNNIPYFINADHQQAPGPWVITAQEQQQNEGQFVVLRPVDGLIGGEQARPFFLKSGLPANILAQIWQLADVNKDGKLDRLEFSIAMKLVRNCLSGMSLPSTLPDSMLRISGGVPSSGSMPFAPPNGKGMIPLSSSVPSRPLTTYGSMPAMSLTYHPPSYGSTSTAQTPSSSTPPFLMGIKELGDWSLPQPLKLRFSQRYNQLDKSRIGLLTGQQARGVLGESQLPTNILAQIWNMSDVNKDGCLSIEEFCTAMYLIEMIKSGYALPPKLPNELHAFCNRSKTVSPSTTIASNDNDPSAPPPQKPGHGNFKTFEDKRKDNLDKGQAELDRRRQILREEEERRRAEIERREREEAERKELERQELERRREIELEAERQQEAERERERAAEEDRLKAEREEARKKMEQERILELEKIRIRDLENQVQLEMERRVQIQQRQHTMAFQLQALEEKSQQLNGEITNARDNILEITQEIEGMREQRDQKLFKINELERNAREVTVQSERFSHENLQLQSEFQRQLSRVNEVIALRSELTQLDEEIQQAENEVETIINRSRNQENLVTEKQPNWEESCNGHQNLKQIYDGLLARYLNVKREQGGSKQSQVYETPPDSFTTVERTIKASIANKMESVTSDTSFANMTTNGKALHNGENNLTQQTIAPNEPHQQHHGELIGQVKTVKYRALYEFNARSSDELNIQPGEVILVFEGHQSEPGWLAGQVKDKIGWFPAAFAEPMASNGLNRTPETVALKKGPSLTGSPSSEPLASICEEGEPPSSALQSVDKNTFEADFSSAFSKSVSFTNKPEEKEALISGSMSASASISAVLYDLPPNDKSEFLKSTNQDPSEKTKFPGAPMYEVPPGDVDVDDITKLAKEVLAVGVALYQWKARNDQEMTFTRGDIIEILEQREMRWRGRLQKNRQVQGWFPRSYVKVDDKVTSSIAPIGATIPKDQEEKQIVNTEPLQDVTANNETTGNLTQLENGEWFLALYQFDAVEATDLSLKPGDRIRVIEQKDQWWRGICNGKTGIFPANYVQRISENSASSQGSSTETQTHMLGRAIAAFEATAPNQLSLTQGAIVRVNRTTPGGWWECMVGELQGWVPGAYIQLLQPSDAFTLAVATFDYSAQREDELTFKAGDVIEVMDQSDTHWWKGRKQGHSEQNPLLFPANFVQINK